MTSPSSVMRPTVSLALIAKNEAKNLPRLFKSVEGCFDEIILVDTGSTDDTKAIANRYGCSVYDFEWVNSFAKARNFAFSKATKDYIVWLDCDDVLHNPEGFIKWRDTAMEFCDMWFATYHYALDPQGKPIISFVRERAFRRSLNPKWKYDLHEGVVPEAHWTRNYITTWAVNHMRDALDIKADKSRNIKILESMPQPLDARMQFYYGKELYESDRHAEAIPALEKAIKMDGIESHDKMLAFQYGAYSALAMFNQLKDEFKDKKDYYIQKALDFAYQGIRMEPNRAELHVVAGDAYLSSGNLFNAISCFAAAKACINPRSSGSPYEGAIYSFLNCYGELPSLQLAKIYFNIGQIDRAKKEARECVELYANEEAKLVLAEIERVSQLVKVDNDQADVDDIVFTCPPQSAYEFDEELYKHKGMGGSETALIEMARLLKQKTGRPVKVFAMREKDLVAESGVEYLSNKNLNAYLAKNKPFMHIAWRHNIKLTNARTYLWCHDLTTPTVESVQNFERIMCLTPFHKDYVQALQGVADDKIYVTRNGIVPEKFKFERKEKNPNKFVWMSSPDRGLDRAMHVMDKVRETLPHAELHVYYGLDNLYKYGMAELAERLKAMMAERPWVKYHGFTEQSKMYRDVSDAVVWCHPCNFIETSCITANEMLALGIYPVTRRLGALKDTLKHAEKYGQATMLNTDCVFQEEIDAYAAQCVAAVKERKWERVHLDLEKHSWAAIADEWVKEMGLAKEGALGQSA